MNAPQAHRAGGAGEPSTTGALAHRASEIDRALEIGRERLDPRVVEKVVEALAGVRERLALGVDHTVVALVGGTGSGKSSLFNALTDFEFADVGVTRPTTSKVTACTWGGKADPLLEWLGVDLDRRIERESDLLGDDEASLRGLVLLDLPDHDSIDPAHREVVDRLLPMVDLLVWVVDPQKYADDALHSGYLRRLAAHEAAMLVVLNQIDTVPADQRVGLAADVGRLLTEDGLHGVPVLSVSARTQEGVDTLRARLAAAVGRRSIAAERAGAELHDASALVATQVSDGEPATFPREQFLDAVAEAAGLPAIADAVEAVVRGNDVRVPSFGAVGHDTVQLARSRWLDQLETGLTPRWGESLASALPGVPELARALDSSLARVGTRATRSQAAGTVQVVAVVALLAGLVGAAVVAGQLLMGAVAGDGLAWPGIGAAAVGGGIGLVLGLVLWPTAVVVRRWSARRRGEAVLAEGREALGRVVDEQLVAPTRTVLDEHRRVRELAHEPGTDGAHRSTGREGPAHVG
ncbi:MAG: 50S ribosome-binding GTPase [Actinomycetota bacterium]|nr:50S ribosome-binding GTPase [Actinomycetota bacterium]